MDEMELQKRFFTELTCGCTELGTARHHLLGQRKALDFVTFPVNRGDLGVAGATLEKLHLAEIARIRAIEEKARANVTSVTLSVTIVLAISRVLATPVLQNEGVSVSVFIRCGLIAAVAYFVAGALASLRAFKTSPLSIPELADYADLDAIESKRTLLFCICSNEFLGMAKSNDVATAMKCIRNGVVCIGVVGIVMILVL